jgi:hypothetical protein
MSRSIFAPALALLLVASCGSGIDAKDVIARLRNSPPPACTAEKQALCPPVNVTSCPAGQEPVIDYANDCCGHFTCQPLCSAAGRTCPMTPAPTCQGNSKLWIGTAIEDCCPAYRCQPDTVCNATNVACTLALPYCGPNVMPIVVGNTADCCPIYQCPCDKVVDATTGLVPPDAIARCGCTYPNCKAGEQMVCAGADQCMGPCECKPARGVCKADAECGAGQKCDVSACRLPPDPIAGTPMVPTCEPEKCGPKPGIPTGMCMDGSLSGLTGRCLLNADGACSWEIRSCPTTVDCYGICVADNPQTGCQANSDCPMGQVCNVACREWSCMPGGTGVGTPTNTSTGPETDPATDPGTGGMMTPPAPPACACDLADNSCSCDATGACKGRTCVGQCLPPKPTCDPMKPALNCPVTARLCPNGQPPVQVGMDPTTCCPTYSCPVCSVTDPAANTAPRSCAAPACLCAKQTGTDPMSCCPTYECYMPNADGKCG